MFPRNIFYFYVLPVFVSLFFCTVSLSMLKSAIQIKCISNIIITLTVLQKKQGQTVTRILQPVYLILTVSLLEF